MIYNFEMTGGTMMDMAYNAVNPLAIVNYISGKGYSGQIDWFPNSMDDLIRNNGLQAGILIYINDLDKINAHYVFAYYDQNIFGKNKANTGLFYLFNSDWGDENFVYTTTSIDMDMKNENYIRMGVITFNKK